MTHPIIALLLSIPPAPVLAIALLHEVLQGEKPATLEEIIRRGPEVEAAIRQADDLAYRSNEAVERCLKLKPVSAPRPPLGF
jgi:hypothetical protein